MPAIKTIQLYTTIYDNIVLLTKIKVDGEETPSLEYPRYELNVHAGCYSKHDFNILLWKINYLEEFLSPFKNGTLVLLVNGCV